ncbi:MAG: peptide chain release factor 1 [Candidatus Kapabacteria bacterium]|nr:peptide chain release factor 1 [Candidatus Kapabacteria bacterium]MDW8226001.1 peptide chain release factor 1 [Bacteroidota bacterium]
MELTLEQVAQSTVEHYRALHTQLESPHVAADPQQTARLARELKRLRPVAELAERYLRLHREHISLQELLATETDPELCQLATAELERLAPQLNAAAEELRLVLLPSDPDDSRNCVVEIRAGTGGEEAALFAADLFRIYQRYAERKGWRLEVIDFSESDLGGFKEIIFTLSGEDVYGTMKFESGVHRVQRVPITESSGRIHTSAATVAVLPEPEEVDIEIREEDLRIDVFRASGHGGQNVNKVETAVRVVHLPTGIVAQCQDERSQHRNREKALKVLRARLYQLQRRQQEEQLAQQRRSQIRTGDRSEKIRTYNFPQNRVTDHRLSGEAKNFTLTEVLEGELDPIIEQLRFIERTSRLQQLHSAPET